MGANNDQNKNYEVKMTMTKNTLLVFGAILIIAGAILKITHVIEPWNDWIFRAGFVLGFIYLVVKMIKPRTNNK